MPIHDPGRLSIVDVRHSGLGAVAMHLVDLDEEDARQVVTVTGGTGHGQPRGHPDNHVVRGGGDGQVGAWTRGWGVGNDNFNSIHLFYLPI
jgi:hypothetical protein